MARSRCYLLVVSDLDGVAGPPFHVEELDIPSEGTMTREVRPLWRELASDED